jgi:predicted transcriptional regulator
LIFFELPINEARADCPIENSSSVQRRGISEGIHQIEKGASFLNEQVESEIDKWLSEE